MLKKILRAVVKIIMSTLGMPEDAQPTDILPTISDTPIQPANNIVNPNQVRSGMTRGIQQLGSDKIYSDGGNNQIVVEDTDEPRVLMGDQATFGEGFYVTKDGYNVKTNTDPSNFIFNSNQNVLKIVSKLTGSIASFDSTYDGGSLTTSGNQLLTVAHNQSFTPIVEVYVQAQMIGLPSLGLITSTYVPLPIYDNALSNLNVYFFPGSGSTSYPLNIIFGVDSTNVYIQAVQAETGDNHTTFEAIPYTIFLFQETAV